MKHFFLAVLCLLTAPAMADDQAPDDTRAQLKSIYFDAAREGSHERLAAFIDAHYDLETRDENGYTALILAAYHGQQAAVEQLLAAGADPCGQDRRGNSALMGAIFKGELSIARRLVDADCAPDQRNRSGQTAAMYAALFQRQDILAALAAKGADLSAKDAMGNDAASLQKGQFSPPPMR